MDRNFQVVQTYPYVGCCMGAYVLYRNAGLLVWFQFYKSEAGTRMIRLQVLTCGTGTGPCRGLIMDGQTIRVSRTIQAKLYALSPDTGIMTIG